MALAHSSAVDVEREDLAEAAVLAPPAERGRARPLALVAAGWLIAVLLFSYLAPLLPIPDPNASSYGPREAPSWVHPFGTDANGRDVLARVAFGGRASLTIAVATALVGATIGGSLGLISGYFRGRLGALLAGVFDTMLAIPPLVLVMALVAVMAGDAGVTEERRLAVLVFGLSVIAVPIMGRITRASTLTWAQREFVTMALTMGASPIRVLVREILPNVLPALLSVSLLAVADVIVVEGSLSILGLGVPLPTPSWGNIIAEGKGSLDLGAVHLVAVPAGFIFLTVLALNHLGDVVRGALDPRRSVL